MIWGQEAKLILLGLPELCFWLTAQDAAHPRACHMGRCCFLPPTLGVWVEDWQHTPVVHWLLGQQNQPVVPRGKDCEVGIPDVVTEWVCLCMRRMAGLSDPRGVRETMPLHFLQDTGRGRSRLLSSWLALGWLSHKSYPCAIISLSSSMNLWGHALRLQGGPWVLQFSCSPTHPPGWTARERYLTGIR